MNFIFQTNEPLYEAYLRLAKLETVLQSQLFPLARRAAVLFTIIRSLGVLHHEYKFTLAFFIKLFDNVLTGSLPENYKNTFVEGEVCAQHSV